jgi:hypothetical protein
LHEQWCPCTTSSLWVFRQGTSSFLLHVKDDLGLETPSVYSVPYKCGQVYTEQTAEHPVFFCVWRMAWDSRLEACTVCPTDVVKFTLSRPAAPLRPGSRNTTGTSIWSIQINQPCVVFLVYFLISRSPSSLWPDSGPSFPIWLPCSACTHSGHTLSPIGPVRKLPYPTCSYNYPNSSMCEWLGPHFPCVLMYSTHFHCYLLCALWTLILPKCSGCSEISLMNL